MKKILPFRVPEVTCHPETAAVFGVLESLNLGKEWIYTNFIMTDAFVLQGDMYHNHLDLVLEPGYDSASTCPWIDRSEIREDILEALTEDNIITILKKLILADNYIYVTVEESVFLHKEAPLYHELFLYGYDDQARRFHVADFTFRNRYSLETVSLEEMEKAYEMAKGYTGGTIVCWRVNKDAKYLFDVSLVERSFKEYLDGWSYKSRYVESYYQGSESFGGIDLYGFLAEHMYERDNQMLKCLHNLYDHKSL